MVLKHKLTVEEEFMLNTALSNDQNATRTCHQTHFRNARSHTSLTEREAVNGPALPIGLINIIENMYLPNTQTKSCELQMTVKPRVLRHKQTLVRKKYTLAYF